MRVLNVSTGRVRQQLIDGEQVMTACVKEPVTEPWHITASGPDGDEVAVHTNHLYAFDRESYDYWAAELDIDRASWGDGQFSENLTLDALDQSQLHIGDHYTLGTATVVVTGPRIPCWKLTWRLGQPKTFMRRFRLSGRSGVYLGVVEPGVVRPGDQLTLVSRAEDAPSVAELALLCDSGTRISPEQRTVIDRALASPHLSSGVRGALDLKLSNLARDAGSADEGWLAWRRFAVAEVVHETPDASSFLLRAADGEALPSFRAGQHVVVRLTEPGAEAVVRTWSLSSWAAEPDHYRITVRMRPDGLGSTALARAATGGVAVDLRSPAGQFCLDRGGFRPVVLVAAGIGITPMVAMVQAHLDRNLYTPPLWLVHAVPDHEQAAFREHLEPLFAQHEDLHLHYFHSQPPASEPPAGDGATVHHGRVTAERVVETIRRNYLGTASKPFLIPWFESDIYLCGSVDFNESLRSGLVDAGASADQVFVEDFAAAAGVPDAPRRHEDASVSYASRGLEATWVSSQEQTLLELAEGNGLDLPFDCRTGSCRTCEAHLLSGEVDGPVTTTADGTRRVLLCSSYPLSDHVVVEPPAD